MEKVVVWDGGSGEGGLANLGKRLVGVLPPMHEVAKMAGLDLPGFLGKAGEATPEQPSEHKPAAKTEDEHKA